MIPPWGRSQENNYASQMILNSLSRIRKGMTGNVALFAISCVVCFLLSEVLLRVTNPLGVRIKGDSIQLPTNVRLEFENTLVSGLDRTIVHSRNSLGFRGADPPKEITSQFKIVMVGGSTTEQLYISDGETWTDVFYQVLSQEFSSVWVNNAGLDGHSTFGHLILVNDYLRRLKPEVAIFLVGVNDVGRDDLSSFDSDFQIDNQEFTSVVKRLANRSESLNLALTLIRNFRAKRRSLDHISLKPKTAETLYLSEEQQVREIEAHRKHVESFRKRLVRLVDDCRKYDIRPVLVTQPALYGCATDPTSGIDLSVLKVTNNANGCLQWRILSLYNEATTQVGRSEDVDVIDLADMLPHDSSLYYDFVHYNRAGSDVVGRLLAQEFLGTMRDELRKWQE